MSRYKQQKHKGRRIISIAAIVTAGVIAVFTIKTMLRSPGEAGKDVIWREYPVERGNITASLDGGGTLETNGTPHGFSSDVKIQQFHVEVGDYVHKGDVLVEYSREQAEERVRELTYTLESAKRALEDAEINQQKAQVENGSTDDSSQDLRSGYERQKREISSSIQKLELQIQQLNAQIGTLQEQIKAAESPDIDQRIDELRTELAALQESTEPPKITPFGDSPDEDEPSAQEDEFEPFSDEDTQAKIAALQAEIDSLTAQKESLPNLREQLRQAQEQLASANLELESQRNALSEAGKDYERQLGQIGQQNERQSKMNALDNTTMENAIQNAQDEVDKAQKQLDAAKSLLDTPALTAKLDGVITAIQYSEGDDVPGGKSIVTIGDCDEKLVTVEISQEDIGSIEVEQAVEMQFLSNPDSTIKGYVREKSLVPTPGGDGVTYQVKIAFDEPQPDLLQGMTCSVKFIQKRVEDVLTLANKAITLRDGKQTVTVLLPDGSHEEREIKTGFSDGRISEITGGLDEGDVAVIAG